MMITHHNLLLIRFMKAIKQISSLLRKNIQQLISIITLHWNHHVILKSRVDRDHQALMKISVVEITTLMQKLRKKRKIYQCLVMKPPITLRNHYRILRLEKFLLYKIVC